MIESNTLKQLVIGTPFGRIGSRAREAWEYIVTHREKFGTIANDQLALYYVTRLCAPGKTFIDAGSHLGSIIAEVKLHCPTVKIIAFEPVPDKASRLREKFADVQVFDCALAEEDKEGIFFIDVNRTSYSSLAPHEGSLTEIAVALRRLDGLVDAHDVDVIKIDVEGAELGVLIGAQKLIARCRPVVMFESGPEEVLDYSKTALFDWLERHDYAVIVPNRLPHEGPPLTKEGFLESHQYPFRTLNYFAVPEERLKEVRERARMISEACGRVPVSV